jgi:hypothetical protein
VSQLRWEYGHRPLLLFDAEFPLQCEASSRAYALIGGQSAMNIQRYERPQQHCHGRNIL